MRVVFSLDNPRQPPLKSSVLHPKIIRSIHYLHESTFSSSPLTYPLTSYKIYFVFAPLLVLHPSQTLVFVGFSGLPLFEVFSQFLRDGFPIQFNTPLVLVVGEYTTMVASRNGVAPVFPDEKGLLTLLKVLSSPSFGEKGLFHLGGDEFIPFLGKKAILVDTCMVFDRMFQRVLTGLMINTDKVLFGLVEYFVIREIGVTPILRFDMLTFSKSMGDEEKWDMAVSRYGILRDGCQVFDGMTHRSLAISGRNWLMIGEAIDSAFCIWSAAKYEVDVVMLINKRYQNADVMFEGLWIAASLSLILMWSLDIHLADNYGVMYSRCCSKQFMRVAKCKEKSFFSIVITNGTSYGVAIINGTSYGVPMPLESVVSDQFDADVKRFDDIWITLVYGLVGFPVGDLFDKGRQVFVNNSVRDGYTVEEIDMGNIDDACQVVDVMTDELIDNGVIIPLFFLRGVFGAPDRAQLRGVKGDSSPVVYPGFPYCKYFGTIRVMALKMDGGLLFEERRQCMQIG